MTIGGVSVTAMLPDQRPSPGHTKAELDGSITGPDAPSSITVQALGENSANADVNVLSVAFAVGATAAFADAEVTSGAYIQAGIGSGATVKSSGQVEVDAETQGADNDSSCNATAIPRRNNAWRP